MSRLILEINKGTLWWTRSDTRKKEQSNINAANGREQQTTVSFHSFPFLKALYSICFLSSLKCEQANQTFGLQTWLISITKLYISTQLLFLIHIGDWHIAAIFQTKVRLWSKNKNRKLFYNEISIFCQHFNFQQQIDFH